ncbi:GNAT family N-acetyltransferase [Microbacterium sp. NPDC089698]|uniref:GNAT family N-acetyltransferase n=1 Tax=Microbacterium sp. NPDC089698 TaxID=3364200 RepID=UPI003807F2BD
MSEDPRATTLTTERLILRAQQERDAEVFHQLWTERDERVPPHRRIDAEGHPTVADIADSIRGGDSHARPGLLTVVLRESDAVIGYCGVVFDDDDRPELAFELLSAVHNRGYATEAGRAVIAWARDAGYPRLWASVWDWNLASRRALEKLGFAETGTIVKESAHGRSLLTVREPGD